MELLKKVKRTSRRGFARRDPSGGINRPLRLEVLEDRCLLTWAYDPMFTSAGAPPGHVFVPNFGEASSIVLQDDRKLVLGGWSPGENNTMFFTLARLGEDGQLDSSFGVAGMVKQQFYSNSFFQVIFGMAIQPADGAIVVAGIAAPRTEREFVFSIMRFHSNGQLDTSFGGTNGDDPGKVSIRFANDQGQPMISASPRAVAIQDDGKILVAGKADFLVPDGIGDEFAIARLNNDGTLDPDFGMGGKRVFRANGQNEIRRMVLLEPDGTGQQKILVTGHDRASAVADYDFVIGRLLSDGRPDPSFATDSPFPGIKIVDFGAARTDGGFDMVRQPDGKIVAAGFTNYLSQVGESLADFALVRVNADGSFDDTFGAGGKTTADLHYYDAAFGVDLQHHGKNAGKIVVAGYSLIPNQGFISTGARFHTDGSLDETFASNFAGTVADGDQARGVVVQPWDDKIVTAGFHTEDDVGGFASIRLCANPRRCSAMPQADPFPRPLPSPSTVAFRLDVTSKADDQNKGASGGAAWCRGFVNGATGDDHGHTDIAIFAGSADITPLT